MDLCWYTRLCWIFFMNNNSDSWSHKHTTVVRVTQIAHRQQWSKVAKAHPVPHRLWQHPSSANPPQHLAPSRFSVPHLSVTHTPFSLPPCPKGPPHPFRSCVASTQCPAAAWRGWRGWHHRGRKGNRQRLFPAPTCSEGFQEWGKIISEAPQ